MCHLMAFACRAIVSESDCCFRGHEFYPDPKVFSWRLIVKYFLCSTDSRRDVISYNTKFWSGLEIFQIVKVL